MYIDGESEQIRKVIFEVISWIFLTFSYIFASDGLIIKILDFFALGAPQALLEHCYDMNIFSLGWIQL